MATTFVQEPYNMFAMQKMAGYPNSAQIQQAQQKRVPGQVVGETPQQFAQGKFNNGQPVVQTPQQTQQTPQVNPVIEQKMQNAKTTPIDANSSTAGMEYLNSLYTTPQEEEKLRKASVANRRIMAVADALRHIGNIYHTINYAPAQQFNNPVAEEQARYERGKAIRDAANARYLTYQQQKAAQDAKARQWAIEQQQKADQWNATFKYNAARDAEALAEKQRQYDSNLAFNKEKEKNANQIRREQIAQSDRNNRRSVGATYASINQRNKEFEYKKKSGYFDRNGGGGRSSVSIATKNGYISLPKDYLTNNAINRETLMSELKNRKVVDSEWLKRYEAAGSWNPKEQERMANEAISRWLRTDDDAEQWMVDHLNGTRGGYMDLGLVGDEMDLGLE